MKIWSRFTDNDLMEKILITYLGLFMVLFLSTCTDGSKIQKAVFHVDGMTIRGGIL